MNDFSESRRVRIFLTLTRIWGIVTLLAVTALLILGALVTSFRAGMADPIWPTEPWYLAVNEQVWKEEKAGFLIEHSHRAMGFIVGGCASLLAMFAWLTERRRWAAIAGLLVTFALLGAYGEFHRNMGQAWNARQAGGALTWPVLSAAYTGFLAAVLVGLGVLSLSGGGPSRWLRLVASLGLVGVMIQGLLGGFRVFLDQLVGTELAAIHGTFAQVVFCVLLSVIVLAGRIRDDRQLETPIRGSLLSLAMALTGSIFLQLIFGVLVRHTGTAVSQRLHILTAFVVAGFVVWIGARVLTHSRTRKLYGFLAIHLLLILVVQVLLGVEAWMGKFAAAGPFYDKLPDQRPITSMSASLRTAHVLIGTGLFAAACGFLLRVGRTPTDSAANP